MMSFEKELAEVINRYSIENESNTPDFVLAKYLRGCLNVFASTIAERRNWYANPNVTPDLPTGISGQQGGTQTSWRSPPPSVALPTPPGCGNVSSAKGPGESNWGSDWVDDGV